MKKRILVRGPCLTQSGYGEHARMILRALKEREDLYDICIVPVSWGQTGWLPEYDEFRLWMDKQISKTQRYLQQQTPFDISFQITIPNEWERLAPVNIGVTAGIETTKVSPLWLQKANEMDKIIVPSNHAKWSFENTVYDAVDQIGNPGKLKLNTEIYVVPYPTRQNIPVLQEIEQVSLEEDSFNYLVVGQWGPRKNMENTIRWWLEECWDQDVGLVIKTSVRKNNIFDRRFVLGKIKSIVDSIRLDKEDRKCKLYLIHGDMSESEIKTLYHHPSIRCMVSATHGEGFGLPLFEFAQTGKLIIATGWSAHLDFLTYTDENGKATNGFLQVDYDLSPVQPEAVWESVIQSDALWAYPREGSFKQRIRQARTKEKKWLPRSQEVAAAIEKNFNIDKINNLVLQTVDNRKNIPEVLDFLKWENKKEELNEF